MDRLINYLSNTPLYKTLKKQLESKDSIHLTESYVGLNPLLIKMIASMSQRDVLVVHHNLFHAQKLMDVLQSDANAQFFPQDEFITTEMLAMSEDLKFERLNTIQNLLKPGQKMVITHPTGYVKKMLPFKFYQKALKTFHVGDDIDIDNFIQTLVEYGYKAVDTVENVGEFSRRGSLIDVFIAGEATPFRIDLFDIEIDSIRRFDSYTQRSKEKVTTFNLYPRTEFFYNQDAFKKIQNNVYQQLSDNDCDQDVKTRVDNELESLKEYNNQDQLSRYMVFMDEPLETISDYLNKPIVIFMHESKIKQAYDHMVDDLSEWIINTGDYPKLGFDFIADLDRVYKETYIAINPFDQMNKNSLNLRGKDAPIYEQNYHQLINDLKKYDHHMTVLITLKDESRLNAFMNTLEDHVEVKRLGKNDGLFDKRINIALDDNPYAFEWFDTNLMVLNDETIFKDESVKPKKYKQVFKDSKKVSHVKQLEKGDYLVHYEHGIGRFLEIKTVELNNRTNDYIVIQYKGEDTLYIPVENIHLVQKYVAHEGVRPKLNKLGSADWAKTKARVRKKIKDIAESLIKLYAEREKIKGFQFSKDNDLTDQFEADFLFQETDDQLKAIEDVKNDMESSRPMDRLICGDVGYGKTEVALRAAFKATLDNKQVAYLAPTTVLSRQHYYTFKERLEKHGITCALLNRFITPAKQKKVLKGLKDGTIDVVLGTHRLLSKDLVYKDLGLLIIDEEQRFGVEHKETIKTLKTHIDVLSLSATPIPRTLQMAITGVKQMSLLETPPANRLPVQTYVLERNEQVVKDAVERELARNGQVFYLYNRVDTIAGVKTKLERLIPDARIVYAHGKMSRLKLEQVIEDFLDHKFDVLVSTTIIETGIDIPNANTLVVHDADKLGLSQLYQLRGRVGRSDRIAYSYMMYDKHKQLTEEALKRLQVIKEFTELGSGYKIAMRDLTIRGAGDILGTEQSGFIDSVGIDLFLSMLKEEIDKEKSKPVKDLSEIEKQAQAIRFSMDSSIPNDYIAQDDLKLEIHKSISDLKSSNDLILLDEELTDRFGKVPKPVYQYMLAKLFENLALEKDVYKTFENAMRVDIEMSETASKDINGERVFSFANELSPHIKLAYKNNRLKFSIDKHKVEKHFLTYAIALLEQL